MNFRSFRHGFERENKELTYLPLEKLRCKPYPKKKLFQTMSLNELSDSIREYGVLKPILVKETGDGFYEIITGERRYRSCLIVGKKDIPAVVLDRNDNNAAIKAITQNIKEDELDYMELAELYRTLIVDHGMTQEEVARQVGKSQSSVANKVRLLRLSDKVVKVLGDHALTERHARALLRLPSEDSQLKILRIINTREFSVAETDLLIKTTLEAKEEKSTGPSKKGCRTDDILDEIDTLVISINKSMAKLKKLGLKIRCGHFDRGSYHEIVLNFEKIKKRKKNSEDKEK